jgi:hypothetical protein
MSANRNKVCRSKPVNPEANAEEKPTPDPGQNPVSRLKALGGGDCDQWNSRISQRLFLAMPGVNVENAKEAGQATLSGLIDINSTDPIEGMLAAQIIAAHEASMHLRQLAWLPEQSFEAVTKFLELAEKAARTVGILTERLDQHRGRGQQQITVKHVTVNADQALVADTITTGRASQKGSMQPPMKRLTTGGQDPMEILTNESNLTGAGGKNKI